MAEINNKKMEKRIKKETKWSNLTDEQREVIRFVLIIVIIIIFVLGVYGISKLLIKDKEEVMTNKVTPGAINYDLVSVGTMFNRPYKEYYVLLYDSTLAEATYYNTLYSQYKNANKVKIYYVDLSLKNNKEYVQKEANKKLTGVNDASFKGTTLVKIKNGKVTTYLDSKEKIRAELDYSAE